jgi:hypothetical protein
MPRGFYAVSNVFDIEGTVDEFCLNQNDLAVLIKQNKMKYNIL